MSHVWVTPKVGPIGIHRITIPVDILGSFAHAICICLFLYFIFAHNAAYVGLLATEVDTVGTLVCRLNL